MKDLAVPDGVRFAWLPAYSPELQPAERLWPLDDEPVANRTFHDLELVEVALVARCRALAADRARHKARARYWWWPLERRAGKRL